MKQVKWISIQNFLINKNMEAKISGVVNTLELFFWAKKKNQADDMLFPEIIKFFAV